MAITAKHGVNWPLIGLLLAALLIRGSILWALRDNLEQDPDAYREIAENVLRHGEFALGRNEPETPRGDKDHRPTAYRPPLYPLVLSNLAALDQQELSLAKVAGLHLVLGVATVWLTWLTARRLLVGWAVPTMPVLAGLLVACDPILLNQQTLLMTETLATFLAVLSLWCLARLHAQPSWFNAALAGGAIGLAILCRPTFLPWLGLVVVALALAKMGRPVGLGWRLTHAAVVSLAAAGILSPWAVRNYRLFGKPIVTTTHGGYTLYLGNNTSFYKYLTEGTSGEPWKASDMERVIFAKDKPLTAEKIELLAFLRQEGIKFQVAKDRWGYRDHVELLDDWVVYAMAKRAIRENPKAFLVACAYRVAQLWSPLPHKLTADESLARRLLRYGTCAWYLGVYALAAVGIWKLRWKLLQPPWLYGVLLCLAFTAVHTFYWTNLRMRAPLMPFVALVAAASLVPAANKQQETTDGQVGT